MKKCFKCGVDKSLSDFYKHKGMADGHLNKCKECTKNDVRVNRRENIDYYRDYDAWRFQNDPKVKERHEKYRGTDVGLSTIRSSRDAWNNSNREAKYAHGVVARAVRSGSITKPTNCPVCSAFVPSRKMHAHHHDYSRPLDIEWMCWKCHKKHHHPQKEGFTPIGHRANTDTQGDNT